MVTLVNRNSASASEIVTRRAAGSRSLPGRRRDDVRQGARAVGLPDQRRRRRRRDDRALLHAERAADPAPVGRHIRRVPDLHAARSDRGAAAPERGTQATPTPAAKSTAAAASSPTSSSLGPVEGFNPTRFGRQLFARQAFASFADSSRAEGDTRMSAANQTRKKIARGFVVNDAMVNDFKAMLAAAEGPDRRRRDGEGRRVRPRDDSLRDRPRRCSGSTRRGGT